METNNINQINKVIKTHIDQLKTKYPIARMAIFGSYTRNEQKSGSDIDIMVEFYDDIGWEFFDLKEELERLLGLKVDLVSKNGVKNQYMNYLKDKLYYVE